MKMIVYIIRRASLIVPVILGVMTITFALIHALPTVDILSSQHTVSAHSKCGFTSPSCSCLSLGINETGSCRNPAYWRVYDGLGLNKPIPVQWGIYMYHSLTFQWGNVSNDSALVSQGTFAYAKGEAVTSFLAGLLPYTIELAGLSLLIILAVAIPLGNLSAVNRNRPIDQISRVMSFSGYAIPGFLFGGLLLMGGALLLTAASHGAGVIKTPWCPTGAEPIFNELYGSWPIRGCYTQGALNLSTGLPTWLANGVVSSPSGFPTFDAAWHGDYWLAVDTLVRMILPALVIAYGAIAGLLRFVRNSMLEVMNLDYIRTARAKGVPEKTVVSRHAGRNSMNVTITVLGLTFAFFIGGFPVVEYVFDLDGVGRALALAVQSGGSTGGSIDIGVIFGSTLLFTYLVVAANIIVDVLYAYLDPRVRLG
jgi:peptide/nickel transport system permease protein